MTQRIPPRPGGFPETDEEFAAQAAWDLKYARHNLPKGLKTGDLVKVTTLFRHTANTSRIERLVRLTEFGTWQTEFVSGSLENGRDSYICDSRYYRVTRAAK